MQDYRWKYYQTSYLPPLAGLRCLQLLSWETSISRAGQAWPAWTPSYVHPATKAYLWGHSGGLDCPFQAYRGLVSSFSCIYCQSCRRSLASNVSCSSNSTRWNGHHEIVLLLELKLNRHWMLLVMIWCILWFSVRRCTTEKCLIHCLEFGLTIQVLHLRGKWGPNRVRLRDWGGGSQIRIVVLLIRELYSISQSGRGRCWWLIGCGLGSQLINCRSPWGTCWVPAKLH